MATVSNRLILTPCRGAWPRRTGRRYGDDDLASCVAFAYVQDGCRHFAQRIRTLDGRCDLSGLDEISDNPEILGVLRRSEHAQRLAHEWRQQNRSEAAVESADPASIGLAADDHERSSRSERSTEM